MKWFRRRTGRGGFGRWFKGLFKRKPKTITPTPKAEKKSVITVFRNKIKPSKINVEGIRQLEGKCPHHLKKNFSITGSKAKVLEQMVADYKLGEVSSSGKTKKNTKPLDKAELNKMIDSYNKQYRQKNVKEVKNNAKIVKKKLNLSKADAKKFDNMVEGLLKGRNSQLNIVKTLLDPNVLTKERIKGLIARYNVAKINKRGISYMMTQSALSVIGSKLKISNLMENLRSLTHILRAQ